jgi:hypothetical protein
MPPHFNANIKRHRDRRRASTLSLKSITRELAVKPGALKPDGTIFGPLFGGPMLSKLAEQRQRQ